MYCLILQLSKVRLITLEHFNFLNEYIEYILSKTIWPI